MFGSAVELWRSGRQAIVEVVGEPGIGKTRLVRAALDRYADDARILAGRAVAAEEGNPFQVFTHAMHDGGQLHGDLPQRWEDAVELAPPGAGAHGARPGPADVHRYRRARALLESAALAEPLVVVLDDLHWADPWTTGLLTHLARCPVAGPLLLVVAYRRGSTVPGWQPLATLGRPPAVSHLDVGPLEQQTARQLLGAGEQDWRAWYDNAAGNPRYLLACAPPGTAGRWQAECELVDEWARLPEVDRTLASAGAVIGTAFDIELLAAAADLPAPVAEAGLARLLRHGLLRADGALFGLARPTLQRLIYDRVPPAWRPTAHRRAFVHLGHRPGPARALAPHLERMLALPGRGAGRKEVAILRQAAAEVSGTEPLTAARWLQAALDALDSADDDQTTRHEISLELAGVLGAAGRLAECRALLHDVLVSLPADLRSRRADAVALCGRMEWLLGHYAEAGELLRQEFGTVDWVASVDGVELAVQYGAVALLAGQVASAAATLAAATELAAERANRATLLAVRGFSEIHEGAVDAARISVAQCAPLIDSLCDAELVDRTEALGALGLAELFLERLPDASRHFRRGEALARRTGRHTALPYLLLGRCDVAYWTGRLADAIAFAREAQQVATAIGSPDLYSFGLAFESKCVAWQGGADRLQALELARQAVQVSTENDAWYARRSASMALANAMLLSGDSAGCARVVLDIGHGPDLSNLQANLRPTWYWMLCSAALMAGESKAAREWAGRAQAQALRIGLSGQRAFADMAWAAVLRAEGDSGEAFGRSRSAVSGFAQAGMLLPRGVALAIAAQAAGELGDDRLAENLRADALEVGRRCGSLWIAELLDPHDRVGAVAGAGGQPAVAAPTLQPLTPRERQVAELTATGATTHAIGRALAISSRTVEAHLSRIYRKLDVPSRAALVALVTRSDRQRSAAVDGTT